MTSFRHMNPFRASVFKLGVVTSVVVGAWFVADRPRLTWLMQERVALAHAKVQLGEESTLSHEARAARLVRLDAQARTDAIERWASMPDTDAQLHASIRALARARGVTIERMEPGPARTSRSTRGGRDARLVSLSLDAVGESGAVVDLVADLDRELGSSKVCSFRLSPVVNDRAGRVRATIETLHVALAESRVSNAAPSKP